MTIVDELKKLIAASGGQTVGVHTIADACKALRKIEEKIENPLKDIVITGNFEATTEQLLGKTLSDIQENIVVDPYTGKITGKSKYISNWTEYSPGDTSFQNGHFLALHVDVDGVSDVTYKVKIKNEATLDSDKIVICYIDDRANIPVVFTASKSGFTPVTRTFDISEIVLEPKPTT